MKKAVKKTIIDIMNMGYRAYIVGGYTRDILLNRDYKDIDIATDMPVEELLRLFDDYKPKLFKYNSIKFYCDGISVDITNFRSEKYVKKRNVISNTLDLHTDYSRRDFNINSIYMDANNIFFDYNNSIYENQNRIIKFIGNPYTRCIEDPSRILRYFYYALKLNYPLEKDTTLINCRNITISKKNEMIINENFIKFIKMGKFYDLIKCLKLYDLYKCFFKYQVKDYESLPVGEFMVKAKYIFISSFPKKYL